MNDATRNVLYGAAINGELAQTILEDPSVGTDLMTWVIQAAAVLETLASDDTPCRHDHHGYCQQHSLGQPCDVAWARQLLDMPEVSPS